jgi:hypothetical protein
MTQDKRLKRRARELAARTSQSYQSALYELDPDRAGGQARLPTIFASSRSRRAGVAVGPADRVSGRGCPTGWRATSRSGIRQPTLSG